MTGTEIALTAICVAALVVLGFVIYWWQKRVYAWQDDILDRISANNFEDYIFAQRIKHEITNPPKQAKPTVPPVKEVEVPPFIQR